MTSCGAASSIDSADDANDMVEAIAATALALQAVTRGHTAERNDVTLGDIQILIDVLADEGEGLLALWRSGAIKWVGLRAPGRGAG